MPAVRTGSDRPRGTSSDALSITVIAHPFAFAHDPANPVNEHIVEAVNRMGGVGEEAERCYQESLHGLWRQGRDVVAIVGQELKNMPPSQYLDRWSLVQLLAELRQESSLEVLDDLLSSAIPEEQSQDPHSFSTVGEEVMIRTTAIEALTRLAVDGSQAARDLLLKHARHENFSVKRAAVQGYLQAVGEDGRATLQKAMPKRDHHILDIRRADVRSVPQAQGGLHLKPCDTDPTPRLKSGGDPSTGDGDDDDKCKC